MMEMQNGMKYLQMEQQLMVIVSLVILVQSQEHVLKMVQMVIGVQLLVLAMVFLYFHSFIYFNT